MSYHEEISEKAKLEARVTAMLLGECSDFEKESLKEELEKNESLRAFHDSIRTTIETVGEAFPNGDEIEEIPQTLSADRRRRVFKHTVSGQKRSHSVQQWLRYAALFALFLGTVTLSLPNLTKARTTAQPELSDSIVEEGLVEPDSEFRFISRKQAGLEEGQATEDLLTSLTDSEPHGDLVAVELFMPAPVEGKEASIATTLAPAAAQPVSETANSESLSIAVDKVRDEMRVSESDANIGGRYGLVLDSPARGFKPTDDSKGDPQVNQPAMAAERPGFPPQANTAYAAVVDEDPFIARDSSVHSESSGADDTVVETRRGLEARLASAELVIQADVSTLDDWVEAEAIPEVDPTATQEGGTKYAERARGRVSGLSREGERVDSESANLSFFSDSEAAAKDGLEKEGLAFVEGNAPSQAGSGISPTAPPSSRKPISRFGNEAQTRRRVAQPFTELADPSMEVGDRNRERLNRERLSEQSAEDLQLGRSLRRRPKEAAVNKGVPVKQNDQAETLSVKQTGPSVGETAPRPTLRQPLQKNRELLEGRSRAKKKVESSLKPKPEINTQENPFSTFSLNVSDVSYKLALSALENGALPDPIRIRSEEFINAFDYRDPTPSETEKVGLTQEQARWPFTHNRLLLRFGVKTAAAGRKVDQPLNLTLLLDNSGSMERADRVQLVEEGVRVLASNLGPKDNVSVVSFARNPRLELDRLEGNQASDLVALIRRLVPEGGTNLEAALDLAYEVSRRNYNPSGLNRVILMTDGAANLGNVEAESLKATVEGNRRRGIALDCFGVGWEGYNDALLETLSRNGDGRYGFINRLDQASSEFADKIAGALSVAASDVKVQIEFNPQRVVSHRQLGYQNHQLKKEQFRDNTVDAAELAAAESGQALYVVQINREGTGDLGEIRVRYRLPSTGLYEEKSWTIPYKTTVPDLEKSSSSLRLAGAAAAFAERLARSPYGGNVSAEELNRLMAGIPAAMLPDQRPEQLAWMIREARRQKAL